MSNLDLKVYTPESPLRDPRRLVRDMMRDLAASRELAWRLFIRDVSAQYRQSILGYLWVFIPPLVASVPFVYLNAQGVIRIGETPIPYAAFAIISMIIWQVFADSLNAPLRSVSAARSILTRINLPREAILLSALAQVCFGFLVRLLLLVGVMAWFHLVPPATALLFPVGILSLILFGFVIGILITPLGLLYSDVQQTLPIITTFLMFLTPVLYPVPQLGIAARVAHINPLTPLIVTTRDWLTIGTTSYIGGFILVTSLALVFLAVGMGGIPCGDAASDRAQWELKPQMADDVAIRVQDVSKKFCRRLKHSLWYGLQDTIGDLLAHDNSAQGLRREEFWAAENVSFNVRRGECLGLIGRNGAGKTTLLKLLSGLIKPDRGRIELRGRLGALIALGAGFNPILTGRENIYVNGSVLGLTRKEIDRKFDSIIDFADIGKFIDTPVQSYSSGMAVRLGFAVAVAVEPDILILDEVLAVGDISFQAKCLNTIAEFRKRGTAFVFVSHNMHMISRYCQNVMYMRDGQVHHLGNVAAGIDRFLSDMRATNSEEAIDRPDWSEPVGSGRLRLVGSQFLNAKGHVVSEIEAGDPVTLVLQYERRDISVKSVILDLVVRDREGELYRSTNIASNTPFDISCNQGQLTVSFEYLPVNADSLSFSFALLDEITSEVYDWKRNLRLSILRNSSHHGKLMLPTKWTLTATK